jgi:hypothetical protein
MRLLIIFLACLQTLKTSICKIANIFRRRWLLPFAAAGGRDMVLLMNRSWIDANDSIPPTCIATYYNSDTHTVQTVGRHGRLGRLPWLSVIAHGKDISEFFSRLRISDQVCLTDEEVLMLYAHQTGWLPTGELDVTLRSGDEVKLTPSYG